MGNVRFAAVPELTKVSLVCEAVGLTHAFYVGGTHVVEFGSERGEAGGCSIDSGRCRLA